MQHKAMNNKVIEKMQLFFRASIATFEFANTLNGIFNNNSLSIIAGNKMYSLHKLALSELEKDTVDLIVINNLLKEMEKLAEINTNILKNYYKSIGVEDNCKEGKYKN